MKVQKSHQIINKIHSINSRQPQDKLSSKLHQYLPDYPSPSFPEQLRPTHNQHNPYRKSLERRLERLFKQQKNIINERYSIRRSHLDREPIQQSLSNDRMESKIRMLEEKYHSILNNTTKVPQRPIIQQPPFQPPFQPPQTHKSIQKELQQIRDNIQSVQKLNYNLIHILEEKDKKKKRSHQAKDLLRSINKKLEDINMELKIKNSQHIKKDEVNQVLVSQINKLKQQLKRQNMQRQEAEERVLWIQNQLRQLNHT